MATYISFLHYTEQGMSKIKESPGRLDAARALFKQHGGELKAFYLTMGGVDAVAIAEAPNDETVSRVLLTLASKGNVRTTTSRAFTEEEYRKLLGSLP